jgi:hypothetical protein
MDYTCAVIRNKHENKFMCSRTNNKCEPILVNVLLPYAMREISIELKDSKYVLVMTDASNHKDLKLVPVLTRYFNSSKEAQ